MVVSVVVAHVAVIVTVVVVIIITAGRTLTQISHVVSRVKNIWT